MSYNFDKMGEKSRIKGLNIFSYVNINEVLPYISVLIVSHYHCSA